MAKSKSNGHGKLSEAEFVRKAITTLRTGNYKGIHTRFSGFNQAFREYYGTDPVAATKRLVEEGVITQHFARGGAMIYLKGEEPVVVPKGTEALAKMGLS